MSLDNHLAELERRHHALEREIEKENGGAGSDDLHIAELKRKKLVLKDEISRLRLRETGDTLH